MIYQRQAPTSRRDIEHYDQGSRGMYAPTGVVAAVLAAVRTPEFVQEVAALARPRLAEIVARDAIQMAEAAAEERRLLAVRRNQRLALAETQW